MKAVLARYKISPYIGKKAAAARSTRLRPIHFSNRGNGRGFSASAEYYKIVMYGKTIFYDHRALKERNTNVKTNKTVLAAAISAALAFSASAQTSVQPGEKVDLKSLPASVRQTINQRAAGREIVQVKREDDANGKWNYEVVVRTNGKESAFEVDPNGKFVKQHTESR